MSTTREDQMDVAATHKQVAILEQFAERMGEHITPSVVFAPPIERDGVTVIPVARAQWRVGEGNDTSPQAGPAGTQAVVGRSTRVSMTPVGYIEVKDGQARFRPIFDAATLLWLPLMGGIFTLLILQRVDKMLRQRQAKARQRSQIIDSPGALLVTNPRGILGPGVVFGGKQLGGFSKTVNQGGTIS